MFSGCTQTCTHKGTFPFPLPCITHIHRRGAVLFSDSLLGNPAQGIILCLQEPDQESTLGNLSLHFYESITHLLSIELFFVSGFCVFLKIFVVVWFGFGFGFGLVWFRDFWRVVVLIESGNYFTSEKFFPLRITEKVLVSG